jgi:hypothetical protein
VKIIAALGVAVATAAAVIAVLLAQDLRAWPGAIGHGKAANVSIPFHAAERILGVHDQLELRLALVDVRRVAKRQVHLEDALDVQGERAAVENRLATLAGSADTRVASQAEDVIGVLAFGDLARGGFQGRPQAETALGAFQNAVRLDPTNAAARWNLEVVLRLLVAHGVRTGPGQGSGASTGRHGASGGAPGRGF